MPRPPRDPALPPPPYHKRPEPGPPLVELIELREKKYGHMLQRDFAQKMLKINRMHMTSIELGRRHPSLELALRWVEVLGPEARISMFGRLPIIEERIRQIKRLASIAPEIFQAA